MLLHYNNFSFPNRDLLRLLRGFHRIRRRKDLVQLLKRISIGLYAEEIPNDSLKRVPEDKDEDVFPADTSERDWRTEEADKRRTGDDEDLHREALCASSRLETLSGVQGLQWSIL